MACPSAPVQNTPPCPGVHCSQVQSHVNDICKAQGWDVGFPVFVFDPTTNAGCYCCCSCLALGTPISIPGGQKAVETFQLGDEVLAAGKDLKWEPEKVEFSQGTAAGTRNAFSVFVVYGEQSLIVTSDHLFLMEDGTLKRADRLSSQDSLVRPDGSKIGITAVHIGDFYGGFHHIATKREKPNENLDGHLVVTNGVVSADYAIQLFIRAGEEVPGLVTSHNSLPIVGTREYAAEHGESKSLLEGVPLRSFDIVDVGTGPNLGRGTFVPAEHTKINIPPDACSFLSDDDAEQIRQTQQFRPFTDPIGQQWAQYLCTQYAAFYPAVKYLVDWADDTVNAYAYIDQGQRYVTVKGGLLRLSVMGLEGIALVLAHETAHHYGGAPTFPSGLSCEGQADYAGANVIMRRVWFGAYYLQMMIPAIDQLNAFLGGSAGDGVPCGHPAGPCRIQTYRAALQAGQKPACAA